MQNGGTRESQDQGNVPNIGRARPGSPARLPARAPAAGKLLAVGSEPASGSDYQLATLTAASRQPASRSRVPARGWRKP